RRRPRRRTAGRAFCADGAEGHALVSGLSQFSDRAARFRRIPALDYPRRGGTCRRSEELTSELQSHLNLVCRLLLEKKKREKKIDNVVGVAVTNNEKIGSIHAENISKVSCEPLQSGSIRTTTMSINE